MDQIKIENLEVFANHGVYPEENRLGQKFLVSALMETDTRQAGQTDELEKSINYGEVAHCISKEMGAQTYQLIEAVAEHLAKTLLDTYDLLKKVTIEVKKPWAPVGLPLESVSVKITRGWNEAYLSIGSNMGDRRMYLEQAVDQLRQCSGIRVERVSTLIETEPYGYKEQDTFLNGAVKLRTRLTPEELLETLHEIEQNADRKRLIHWGPRTLDLDILFYEDAVFSTDTLCIPHPDLENRQFVLQPMVEIAPYLRHPISKKTMTQLLEALQ
ncbi:MAG: 2-amino-4-hydroxy-6-hydroxymethyldihydropteridine diphosphokinase [Lachnospiraceae bacterium]